MKGSRHIFLIETSQQYNSYMERESYRKTYLVLINSYIKKVKLYIHIISSDRDWLKYLQVFTYIYYWMHSKLVRLQLFSWKPSVVCILRLYTDVTMALVVSRTKWCSCWYNGTCTRRLYLNPIPVKERIPWFTY